MPNSRRPADDDKIFKITICARHQTKVKGKQTAENSLQFPCGKQRRTPRVKYHCRKKVARMRRYHYLYIEMFDYVTHSFHCFVACVWVARAIEMHVSALSCGFIVGRHIHRFAYIYKTIIWAASIYLSIYILCTHYKIYTYYTRYIGETSFNTPGNTKNKKGHWTDSRARAI